MADAGYLTIGKVVKKLQQRYPDLSISKVRYLEDEGLLTPSRTPGGYRLYSARDIQRLETILHLQKTRFLPLSVIKRELDGGARLGWDGMDGEGPAQAGGGAPPGGDLGVPTQLPDDLSLGLDEARQDEPHPIDRMPELLGVSISLVRKLADCGIIRLTRSPAGRDLVSGRDLRLIRACAELARFGIEPKNLRQYRAAANREIPMFEQALLSLQRHPGETAQEREARRSQALARMLALTNTVRAAIIERELGGQ